jgi:hypothetical protein
MLRGVMCNGPRVGLRSALAYGLGDQGTIARFAGMLCGRYARSRGPGRRGRSRNGTCAGLLKRPPEEAGALAAVSLATARSDDDPHLAVDFNRRRPGERAAWWAEPVLRRFLDIGGASKQNTQIRKRRCCERLCTRAGSASFPYPLFTRPVLEHTSN